MCFNIGPLCGHCRIQVINIEKQTNAFTDYYLQLNNFYNTLHWHTSEPASIIFFIDILIAGLTTRKNNLNESANLHCILNFIIYIIY